MLKKKTTIILILLLTLLIPNTKVTAFEQGLAGISKYLDNYIPTYNWTTEVVNFREEPSFKASAICKISKREKVVVLNNTDYDKWIQVLYKDIIGYIHSDYLRDTELPSLNFTDEEIEMIAKIMWLESRGESDKGMAAVCRVIINRLLSINFGDTVYKVLSDKNQFTTWKNINTAEPTEREYRIINEVLNGEWDNVLNNKHVYFGQKPYNNKGIIKIGNHYFCEE